MSTENPNNQKELLELYKFHTELADKLSERRESVNRRYAGLLAGVSVLAASIFRFGVGDITPWAIVIIGILGYSLSLSWIFVIRSYRQLNTAKFKILCEMEENLPCRFFQKEKEILNKTPGYRGLIFAETVPPFIFILLFTVVMHYGIFNMS